MPPQTVLITGANGFLGANVTLEFLKSGWRVRATTRSSDKADKMKALPAFKEYVDQLEFAIIEDIETSDFSEAVKGVDAVAHTASPFNFTGKSWDKDYKGPAVRGTKNVLEAAAKEKSVKHVVVTSSFASVGDFAKPPTEQSDVTYTEADWNPLTDEYCASHEDAGSWYCASKKLAEKAAFEVQKESGASWSLSTICPPMIFGPIVHDFGKLSNLNESSGQLWSLVSGEAKEIPDTAFPSFADVRNVAQAHVRSTEKGINGRFLISNANFDSVWVADFARQKFESIADRIPKAKEGQETFVGTNKIWTLDASKSEKELGIKYFTREETFGETISQYLQLEKEGKA